MQNNELDFSEIENLNTKIKSYFPSADLEFIKKAFVFSKKAHQGQFRRSGEAYIFHPIGVAEILADLRLDLPTIATGLLHDTVEDTGVTLEQIEAATRHLEQLPVPTTAPPRGDALPLPAKPHAAPGAQLPCPPFAAE